MQESCEIWDYCNICGEEVRGVDAYFHCQYKKKIGNIDEALNKIRQDIHAKKEAFFLDLTRELN